ncbi:glutamate-cysteine ligase family protein [Actinoplanes regularis]|uniref:glutamate--cysteine ligase n=1 Tax=Actinoplanes regularis TaxID=52697 RepID=A0A239EUM8_9ACTN|nr:glutamate-cysteine ligase family protein [Actinoplanes regularis]GIE89776.1 hypothetical protein Are01nite_62560 [Actinoplanes regularis]SNS48356.1 Glutamate-cysteine ligase family 2(GCS2) [Actinoplanes regularis]
MTTLSEQAAEEFFAARAFDPGLPGFVGIAVDLLLDPASVPTGRRPLRHGFLDSRSPRVAVVSGPPSPGLEVALRRMSDDLNAATRVMDRHGLTALPFATDTAHPDGPAHAYGTATAGLRVGLEAGPDGDGPLGLNRRWILAHTVAPVLAAAFANAPLRNGRPTGWRSIRQALRRDLPVLPQHTNRHPGPHWPQQAQHQQSADRHNEPHRPEQALPQRDTEPHRPEQALPQRDTEPRRQRDGLRVGDGLPGQRIPDSLAEGIGSGPAIDARTSWAAYVMDAPTATGRSLRDRFRAGARFTEADLLRHVAALRPPVAARGHLEIDVVDRQPGDGWRLPAAVITALLDDPRAAEEAYAATVHLADEPRLWERAARDALTDPVLADAARACFLAAYASFARQGVARELRDALADFTDAYVNRGRCPADDLLDRAAGRV